MVPPMKWIAPLLLLCVACGSSSSTDPPDPTPDVAPSPDTSTTLWTEACPTDTVEFRTIDVGEVSLNVACRGNGPTLVLLHGFPEFWYGWNEVMDQLSSKSRLIVPAHRGSVTAGQETWHIIMWHIKR